jgi:hypothetical protein
MNNISVAHNNAESQAQCIPNLMPPTKVNERHIKHGYLDKNADFIKLDRLLSVTPNFNYTITRRYFNIEIRFYKYFHPFHPSHPSFLSLA